MISKLFLSGRVDLKALAFFGFISAVEVAFITICK